jgi:perosamine synthetase
MSLNTVLAINGGKKSVTMDPGDIFKWPMITKEHEDAVLGVLRSGRMSMTEITREFADKFASWMGLKYGLGYPNGTESIRAAMWACGLAAGDEIICPSMTYWASCLQALSLGVAVNFADIQRDTLCIDPADIEHRIGPRTRAIVVVHYSGYPCDMDAIMSIARRNNLKVIEDVSHAQGGLYKGKKLGSFGDVAGISLMSGKPFALGEAGMLVTDDRAIYERAIAYGHYERTGIATRWASGERDISLPELTIYSGLPIGGFKHRMNQICAAVGLVTLKYYDSYIAEIQAAMNRFWDLLEGVPGLKSHRPPKSTGSTMGGWYNAKGIYHAEELGGLSCSKFMQAIKAEGVTEVGEGANQPLHLHEMFHSADIFRIGKPTMISFGQRDVRQGKGSLPVSESINDIAYGVPWFKHDRPDIIGQYAAAFKKVALNYKEIL